MTSLELRVVPSGFLVRSNDGGASMIVKPQEPVRKGGIIFLTQSDFWMAEDNITRMLGLRPEGE